MPSVFDYTDYRAYLSDWFADRKKRQPGFSYGFLAQKAGFSDRGFFHNVLRGRRDLTKESLVKISQAIGHTKTEAEYFENLVFFNKATGLKERTYFYEKLNGVKSTLKNALRARQIRKDQYEFYSRWYHSAIRSLIGMYPFRDDYRWLAKNVFPAITAAQARKSVRLLRQLGLVVCRKDGVYELADRNITTGGEVTGLAVLHFHREAADLVKNALEKQPAGKRNVTGLTLGISEKTYKSICDELRAFRARIVEMCEKDEDADRTYQLNFHLYPVTNTEIKSRGNL